ncbi:calpain family cysteine protease (macronuclear) [Tetrahymena thermophila SB210]|uniref:Calpain family cysteine protease n=1 Tax=Tetrahymena thermophila (strain SB210) TaxID=312017 RepID=I7M0D7_TETTS|nr:calpain family cysteine protease [Tetrahymena thermophila SB210]EAR87378.2 calpain family cysteine protease [Tetrahymena thermophila SB210]|eukprot:XP_001007623.2 calpain family cysteine protease [Tetrahymena thermophila SB210]
MGLKKINFYQKLLFGCFKYSLFLLQVHAQLQQQSIPFAYSQSYSFRFDITNNDGAFTKIKTAKNSNLVFASAGLEGILIIDTKTNQDIARINLYSYINTLEVTSDGQFLFLSLNNTLSVASFESRSSLKILSQSNFPTNITNMVLGNSESILYAVGVDGYVIAYDVKNKYKINQLLVFETNSITVHTVQVSPDNKWLILANDQVGLQILRIIITNNTNTNENNILNFTLAAQGTSYWKIVDAAITDQMDYIYSLDNWFGIFICRFDIISNANQSQYPIQINNINFWPFQTINPSTYCLSLIQNSNYLVIGLRSQGIFIFNIQDRENPNIYQIIPIQYNSFSIALSPLEDYIYYSIAESILIFQKVSLNLNDNYPNFFNVQQSLLKQTSEAYYKWRCYVKKVNQQQYFFGAFDVGGYIILNITDPYNYKQILSYTYPTSIVDSIAISQSNQYMLIPVQENKTSIIVYDISTIQNPVEVFRMKMQYTNHNEALFFSKNQQLVALSFDDGALLIDSSQLPQLYLLDYWKKFGYMIGECSSAIITNDNKYLIRAVREYGYFSLSIDLNSKSNILKWQYTLKTLGGEGLIPSAYDDRYLYIYDGSNGVGVIDATQLPILVVISRVPLNGWSNLIVPTQQDNLLFVAQNESGAVSLIDASDKTNLLLISQFQYQNRQQAQSLCLTLDQQQIFVNNNQGTLIMPLQSQIRLHTDFQLVSLNSSGYTNYTRLQNNNFKVGQQIKMSFLMLYPIEGAQIVGAQYYLNYRVQDLPSWIQFDTVNQNIFMAIDKQALGTSFNKTNLNMILLKTSLPIDQDYFIFDLDDGSSTSELDSSEIFNILREQEIITNNGYLSSNFDHTLDMHIKVNETILSDSLQSAIRQKLQNSIFINQILFYVTSSLQLNLNNSINPVTSLSQSVEIEFLVNFDQGKFILSDYIGLIISTSTQQNQIILKGSLQSLNSALQQKIVFFPLIDLQQIYVTITLSDDINYSHSYIYKASECPIIRQKVRLQSNSNLKLQKQFNQKYFNGIISIQQFFSIDFIIDSFIDEENSQIQLKAYFVNGNLIQEIQSDDWLQFRTSQGFFSFEGTPSSSQLFQVVIIGVIADDGYSQAQDEFTITIKDIPFTYILNIILQILGPLLALLKVYYSRYIFLNCIYKRKVTFSHEKAITGKLYFKKFILMGNDMQKCINLFQGFLQEETKKQNEKPQNNQNLIKKEYFSPSKILSPQINMSSQLQNNSTHYSQKLEKNEVKLSHNSYLLGRYSKIISKQLNKADNSINDSSFSEDQFMQNKANNIQMENILSQINKSKISFRLGGKKYSPESFQLDFMNPDSRIYRGLESLAGRYYLRKDEKSYNIYKYLKLYSIEYSRYNKNDWYKYYVNLHHNQKKDIYGMQVLFPILTLQEQAINLALQKLSSKTTISISSASNFGINFNLIKNVLFSDALGLVNYMPNYLQPCKGISIHLHSYEVKGVQAYKLVNDSRFSYLRKLLNIEYNEYGTSKNRSLPNWLELEHNNGVIQLKGIPMSQDAENIFLRIINSKDYVIQQFSLSITQQAINQRNLPNILDETFNMNNLSKFDESCYYRHDINKLNSFYSKNREKSAFHKQQQQQQSLANSILISESPLYQFPYQSSIPNDIKDESFGIINNDQILDQESCIFKKCNVTFDQIVQDNEQQTQNIFQHLKNKQNEKNQSKQLIQGKQIILSNFSKEKNFQNKNSEQNNENENFVQSLSNTDLNSQNEDVFVPGIRLFQHQQENNRDKHFEKIDQKMKILQ